MEELFQVINQEGSKKTIADAVATTTSALSNNNNNTAPAEGGEEVNTRLNDAVSQVVVDALRRGFAGPDLAEFLSTTSLESAKAEALVAAYNDVALPELGELIQNNSTSGGGAASSSTQQLVGLRWESGHCLGDRTVDPPSRSLPFITLNLDTVGPDGNPTPGGVPLVCSAEQATDLLAKLKEALHEAQVASGASAAKKGRK